MELDTEYLIETLYSYCKRPIYKKYQNIYNAECPVCKEGKSAGRTRRLFYFPNKQYFYCHNCVKSWRTLEWVKEVTGLTVPEILKKNEEKSNTTFTKPAKPIAAKPISDLPENSIDVTDEFQYDFFRTNKYVKLAKEYCEQRRLLTAVNSCKKFYVSLEDKVHKNRLVIPFLDTNNKTVCYQTRALTQNQFPKYLTKFGEKELFNFANVTSDIPYAFVFEGPIDSMFVKNGVAMASLAPTEKQQQQLNSLIGHEQIFVFDNDKNNKQVAAKVKKYIKEGKRIFIWPKEFSKYKDFNEVCCGLNLDEIPWKFVVKNSAKGDQALLSYTLALTPNCWNSHA